TANQVSQLIMTSIVQPGLQTEALRAVEVLLTHWDHEHFQHATEDTDFKPRSSQPAKYYRDPNAPQVKEEQQKVELEKKEAVEDANLEGMVLDNSESLMNLEAQIPESERKMFAALPETPTGLGGIGVWKYKTTLKGFDERKGKAQFYTVFSTPTQTAPVPRATAGVWFTYQAKTEEERQKQRPPSSLVDASEATKALETKATLTYRFEHTHMSHTVPIPNDVNYLPMVVPSELTASGKTLGVGAASKRVPEIIKSRLVVSKDVESGKLLNANKPSTSKRASLNKERLSAPNSAGSTHSRVKETTNANGVPISVIEELAKSENYPVLTAKKLISRSHLKPEDVAPIPDVATAKVAEIQAQQDAIEEERKARVGAKEQARLSEKAALKLEILEKEQKQREEEEKISATAAASATQQQESPEANNADRPDSRGSRYVRSGARRLSRSSITGSFLERRSSQTNTPGHGSSSVEVSKPVNNTSGEKMTGSKPSSAGSTTASRTMLHPTSSGSGGSLPSSRRPSSLTSHWLNGLPDVQGKSISTIDLGTGTTGTVEGGGGSEVQRSRSNSIQRKTTVEVIDVGSGSAEEVVHHAAANVGEVIADAVEVAADDVVVAEAAAEPVFDAAVEEVPSVENIEEDTVAVEAAPAEVAEEVIVENTIDNSDPSEAVEEVAILLAEADIAVEVVEDVVSRVDAIETEQADIVDESDVPGQDKLPEAERVTEAIDIAPAEVAEAEVIDDGAPQHVNEEVITNGEVSKEGDAAPEQVREEEIPVDEDENLNVVEQAEVIVEEVVAEEVAAADVGAEEENAQE
ncbi:hypothetical protein HDV05_005560, partial [Chytridiales sp. JEL 0842]